MIWYQYVLAPNFPFFSQQSNISSSFSPFFLPFLPFCPFSFCFFSFSFFCSLLLTWQLVWIYLDRVENFTHPLFTYYKVPMESRFGPMMLFNSMKQHKVSDTVIWSPIEIHFLGLRRWTFLGRRCCMFMLLLSWLVVSWMLLMININNDADV